MIWGPTVTNSFCSLRLYETQVKKIVKVQSMMRAFLAKRNVASKMEKIRQNSGKFFAVVVVVAHFIFIQ